MGLNAYFTYTVCLQDLKGIEDPWRIALTAVFIEGIIFILLSFFKLRETIANSVSANLKYGITAGIGLFIALIGLKSSGVVVANEATLCEPWRYFQSPDGIMSGRCSDHRRHEPFSCKGFPSCGAF